MADSNLNNLTDLNSAEIFQPKVFEDIKYQSFYFIESIDRQGAADYSKILERVLEQAGASNKNNDLIYQVLVFWMLRLKVFGFECLSQQDKIDLFKRYLVEIFKNDLDFKSAIFRYVDIFESGTAVIEQTRGFNNSLTASSIILGSNTPSFKTINFQPTVSNWLKQYQYSINKRGPNTKPAAFDMVNFIDNEAGVKYLNQKELEILKQILELYNWLLNPVVYAEEKDLSAAKIPYINRQKFELPKEIQNTEDPKTLPFVLSPKTAAVVKSIEEITPSPRTQLSDVAPQNQNLQSQNPMAVNKPAVVMPPSQPQGRLNVQDILKSRYEQEEAGHGAGLSIGGGVSKISNGGKNDNNYPSSSQASKQADIDKKLEDLEKRIKT